MYDFESLGMKPDKVRPNIRIVSVQRYNNDTCTIQVSEQSQNLKFTFYCPLSYVGKLVECNILNP